MYIQEKRKAPPSSDRHKTAQRRGELPGKDAVQSFLVGLAYDPRSWRLELDTKKSVRRRLAPTGIRMANDAANFRKFGLAYDPRSWRLELDTALG